MKFVLIRVIRGQRESACGFMVRFNCFLIPHGIFSCFIGFVSKQLPRKVLFCVTGLTLIVLFYSFFQIVGLAYIKPPVFLTYDKYIPDGEILLYK